MTRIHAFGGLLCIGMAWGLTLPLTKIAVRGGYHPLGMLFWQMVIGSVILGLLQLLRRRPFVVPRRAIFFGLVVVVMGTILPGLVTLVSYRALPASVMSVLLSATPLFGLPLAVAFGTDRFTRARILGLGLGFAGVVMIVVGSQGLPQAVAIGALLFALLSPLCYAFENNYVAWNGTEGLGPFQTIWLASCLGVGILLPVQFVPGIFLSPAGDWTPQAFAFVAASVLHTFAYSALVWLVTRAGAVFAIQVSYLVTTFGVLFSFVLLGERFSPILWLALVVMLAGVALVQPKESGSDV